MITGTLTPNRVLTGYVRPDLTVCVTCRLDAEGCTLVWGMWGQLTTGALSTGLHSDGYSSRH